MDVDKKILERIVGPENVSDDVAELYIYGSDASVHQAMPDMVVRPGKKEEVQEILKYADKNKIPVVARGSGSGMSGQAVPIDAGIVMDMKRMNRIIAIRPEDVLCVVEPGVVDDDLNRALKPCGFFFPPTPASSRVATIGGEIANNASGLRSVKYGATRDSVLGMKVVLANGNLVTLGSNTRVEASGYQLARLMVGSEGTLGVIVEATLRLTPIPKFKAMGMAKFNELEDAGRTITKVMSSGIVPSVLELMDNVAITAVNTTMNMGLPDVEAIIMFEADGRTKAAVDADMDELEKICEENGAFGIETSDDPKEMTRIFSGRKKLFAALSRYQKGLSCTSLADDMAVPNSKMAETVREIIEVAKRNNVVMTAYGHCGSGVVHTKILMDPTKRSQWADARKAVSEVYRFVHSVGGTTSGEHGIALSKAPSWKEEKKDSLEMMRAIKKALDPNNILNPHKLMDAPDDWVEATELRYTTKT
ncbi:MAG: FAD-binding oxidoreductase [bacterium]